MHIILLILKIIGIVLLIILGVLLLFLGLILFAPIRYKAKFEKEEDILLKAMASWLFPLLIVTVSYENEVFLYHIKVLGITIYPRKKRTRKRKKSTEAEKEPELVITQIDSDSPIEKKDYNQEPFTGVQKKQQKAFDQQETKKQNVKQKKEKIASETDEEEKDSKLNNIKEILFQWIDFLKEEENKSGFLKIWNSLKSILKHLAPTKLTGRLVFGTGDPCSTGQILGVLGIFYVKYGTQLVITPDFEKFILEGEIFVKGRIRVFTLLYISIKLLLDKNFKRLKRNFDKMKEDF